MFGLGFTEILAIGIILFVFFGAKRLPALGSSLAQGIRNFQKGIKGIDDEPKKVEEGAPEKSSEENKESEHS